MIITENKQRILDLWGAFATRDVELILSFFHEDAIWIAPHNNATAVALGGASGFQGAELIARFIAEDFGRLFVRDTKSEFRGLYADSDIVVAETRLQATLAGGQRYDNDYCFIFEMRDGRISVMREYMDTAKGYRMIFGEQAAARFDASI
jgi:ketosteroid isomerase-like protein